MPNLSVDLSEFSLAMALLCFSLTVTIGSVMVLRSKGRSFWLAGFVFALALIRFLIPFEFGRAYVIDCLHIYPGFMYLLWRELWPGFSVGLGLVLVWTVVAVGKLLWLGRTLYRQHQIVRQCRVLSEETPLSRLCRRAAGDVGCRRPIQVGISSQVSTAMLAGFEIRRFFCLQTCRSCPSSSSIIFCSMSCAITRSGICG